MKVLIFGAKGQLGRDLQIVYGKTDAVRGLDLPELDIGDRDAVQSAVKEFNPDLVVNAAAYTNVEKAEEDEAAAFRVNETGAANVADAAATVGAPVVYYSTDYVFGGSKTSPYEPDDPIAPIGVYARSKAAGEEATRSVAPGHFVVRTAWLYGPGGDNFVEKILRAAASRPSLKVVADEVGSPTHTLDLAEATQALTQTRAYGTYHCVNAGSCSRFDFARAILDLAGVDIPVASCLSDEFPTKAERPLYSVLSVRTLEEVTGYCMRDWRSALKTYMTRREA